MLAWNQGRSEVCFGVHVLLDLCVPQFPPGGVGTTQTKSHIKADFIHRGLQFLNSK